MSNLKILVCRTDRLGDALLSLPTLEFLRRTFPEAALDFCFTPGLREVIGPYLQSRKIEPVPYVPRMRLDGDYDAALLLHAAVDLQFKAFLGRIPKRYGNYSKPASFLLLNGGRRQRRSRAEKNEGEY